MVFQKLALPLLPSLHAGNGLLKNDAFVFHQTALSLALDIHQHGWSRWSLFPPGSTGNTGLLSGIYALFGSDPVFFIPFSAAAHALGATLIYKIGSLLLRGNVGMLGGVLAALVFLLTASSLQWYSQPLKDSFAISGVFLVLLGWIYSLNDNPTFKTCLSIFVKILLGSLLITFVRPYFTIAIAQILFLVWLGIFFWCLLNKNTHKEWKPLLCSLMVVLIVLSVGVLAKKNIDTAKGVYGDGEFLQDQSTFEWDPSSYLPASVDGVFKRAAFLRSHFIDYNREVNAGSAIDLDRRPKNAIEVIQYLPRALQVGLFSPFPETWSEKVTPLRLIAAIEASIWYLFFFGIGFLIYRSPSKALFSVLIFCALMIVMLTIIHPNIGTLYRQRFGFWMLFLLCGSLGWASNIPWLIKFTGDKPVKSSSNQTNFHQSAVSLSKLATSGSLVVGITFLCYLGFLIRDLLLITQFGMISGLDGFFIAVMVPMVLVTCLSMPLGDAVTNLLINVPVQKIDSIIRQVMTFATMLLGLLTVVIAAQSKFFAGLFLGQNSLLDVDQAATLLAWFSPILFLSAWTVIGNAIMNVLHRSMTVSLAQLIVPLCSIGFILIDPGRLGLFSAVIGMLIGTLLNSFILFYKCRTYKIYLIPSIRLDKSILPPLLENYRWLLLAAIFSAASTPLNYLYAGSVGDGAITMWAISGKLTQVILGLIGAGVASLLLPHFARLNENSNSEGLKSHVYLSLMVASLMGFLVAIIYVEFSTPIASILYLNANNSSEHINIFANLLRIGALQISPVICIGIIVKLTAATNTSSKSVLAISLGLLINLGLDHLLVPSFGVLGVGIATLIGSIFSAAYLVVGTRKLTGINVREIFTLFFVWTLCGFLNFLLVY